MTLLTWDPNNVGPESHHTVTLPITHAWIKQAIAVLLAQGAGKSLACTIRAWIHHRGTVLFRP
jgi:hypothetical protein